MGEDTTKTIANAEDIWSGDWDMRDVDRLAARAMQLAPNVSFYWAQCMADNVLTTLAAIRAAENFKEEE